MKLSKKYFIKILKITLLFIISITISFNLTWLINSQSQNTNNLNYVGTEEKIDFTSPEFTHSVNPYMPERFLFQNPTYFFKNSDREDWWDDMSSWNFDEYPETHFWNTQALFIDNPFKELFTQENYIQLQLITKIDSWMQMINKATNSTIYYDIFDIKNINKYWECYLFINNYERGRENIITDTSYDHTLTNNFNLERKITIEEYINIVTTPNTPKSEIDQETWNALEQNRIGIYFGAKPENMVTGWLTLKVQTFKTIPIEWLELNKDIVYYDEDGRGVDLSVGHYIEEKYYKELASPVFNGNVRTSIEKGFCEKINEYLKDTSYTVSTEAYHRVNFTWNEVDPMYYRPLDESYAALKFTPIPRDWYSFSVDRRFFDFDFSSVEYKNGKQYSKTLQDGDQINSGTISVEVDTTFLGSIYLDFPSNYYFEVNLNTNPELITPELPENKGEVVYRDSSIYLFWLALTIMILLVMAILNLILIYALVKNRR